MSHTTVETTITDLVLEPPLKPRRPQPAGMRLALMRADPMPVSFYRYLYGEIGRDYLWVDLHGLADDTLLAQIQKPGVEITVLYANGAPAGYFELDFSDEADVSLVMFGLMRLVIGRGIGPWLLGCAIDEGFSRGASRMNVNTCTLDHPRALAMYQKAGFRPIAQRQREVAVPPGFSIPDHVLATMG